MSYSSDDDEVEYELEPFTIGEYQFQITTVAHMPITKLLANQSKGIEISGQKLWLGSFGVMEYLLSNNSFVIDNIVVELGAGTGVLGMICRKIGANSVYLTDNDIMSIKHMKNDIIVNHVSDNVTVLHYDWFQPNIDDIVSSLKQKQQLQLDYSMKATTSLRIVAGDVLYKRILIEPFMNAVKCLLSSSLILDILDGNNAEMLLCHIPRAGVTHEIVIAAAEKLSLTVTEIPKESWVKNAVIEYCPKDDIDKAKLYKIIIDASKL